MSFDVKDDLRQVAEEKHNLERDQQSNDYPRILSFPISII